MSNEIIEKFPPIITDRYEIIHLLGEGGMSSVYLAQDKQLPRKIAIKCILNKLSEKDEVRKRIEREVQIHASIGPHPNIVTLFDKIEDAGRTFLIMEYIEGDTLDIWSKNHDYTQPQIISIITEILNALKIIHSRNIVHRDIKPENIIVSTDVAGDVSAKLMDFGISYDENLNSTATKLTQLDVGTPGSPAYMSPEQIDSKTFGNVGPASDLYSVGIIFYELLTKTPPFTGTMTQILTGHLVTTPGVEKINFTQPFLKSVLQKVLSKKQQDRYTSAEQFLADLADETKADQHKNKTQLVVELDSKEAFTKTQLHVPHQAQSSSRSLWIPIILVLGAGAIGAVYYINTTEREDLKVESDIPEQVDETITVSKQGQENTQLKLDSNDAGQDEKLTDKQITVDPQMDELPNSSVGTVMIKTDDPSSVPSPINTVETNVRPIDPLNYIGPTPDYSDNSTGTQATDTFKALREKKLEQTSSVTTQKATKQKVTTGNSTAERTTTTTKKSTSQDKSSSSSGWSVTGSTSNKVN